MTRQVKMVKHLAKIRDSDARVLVIFMTIPGEEDSALVLHMDTLQDHIRDEISELVETPEAQNVTDFGVLLKRKTLKSLAPNISALDWLHSSRKLEKVLTKNVIMTPNSMVRMPLNTLNEQMKLVNKEEVVKAPEVKNDKLWGSDYSKMSVEDKRKVAENLLFEAKLLREDADAAAKQKEISAQSILSEIEPVVSKDVTTKKKAAKKSKAV